MHRGKCGFVLWYTRILSYCWFELQTLKYVRFYDLACQRRASFRSFATKGTKFPGETSEVGFSQKSFDYVSLHM